MDSVGKELERLARLRAAGDLSDEEYDTLKARLLDAPQVVPPTQEGSELTSASTPKPEEIKRDSSVQLPAIRFASWVLLSFNALMGLFVATAFIATTTEACDGLTGDDLELCQGATMIGASIGVTLIFIVWAVVDVILITVWIATRSEPPKVPGPVSRVLGLGLFLAALALGISGVVNANSEQEVNSTPNRSPAVTFAVPTTTTRSIDWVRAHADIVKTKCIQRPEVIIESNSLGPATYRIWVELVHENGKRVTSPVFGGYDLPRSEQTFTWKHKGGFSKWPLGEMVGDRCRFYVARGPENTIALDWLPSFDAEVPWTCLAGRHCTHG